MMTFTLIGFLGLFFVSKWQWWYLGINCIKSNKCDMRRVIILFTQGWALENWDVFCSVFSCWVVFDFAYLCLIDIFWAQSCFIWFFLKIFVFFRAFYSSKKENIVDLTSKFIATTLAKTKRKYLFHCKKFLSCS